MSPYDKTTFGDSSIPALPPDLPIRCCGFCRYHTRIINLRGRCDWPPTGKLPSSYGPGLTRVDEGQDCPVFQQAKPLDEDLPLFAGPTDSGAPVDIFQEEP